MLKKVTAALLLCFCAGIFSFVQAAPAKKSEINDKRAVGYDVNYGAVSFKMMRNEARNIQVLFAANYESKGDQAKSAFDFLLGVRSRKQMLSVSKLKVDNYFGLAVERNENRADALSGQTNLYFELGAAPEYFILDDLSVELSLGMRLVVYGESRSGANDAFTQLRTFGSGVNFFPGLSFHYYFGK